MTWIGVAAGIGVAAVVIVPIALKWQLPLRGVVAWTVVVGAVAGGLWNAVLGEGSLSWQWVLLQVATVAVLSIAVLAFAFYRDPERIGPSDPGLVVSPADGTVLYVRQFSGGEVPPIVKHGVALDLGELARIDVGDTGHVVGIGMHLANVHVNRAPVAGRVSSLGHVPGQFVSLRREGATTLNERFTTVIDGDRVRVVVVQIASRLVRRIESYLKVGEMVARSQRIGIIKFGSQVDVILPESADLELVVRPGDIVRAGVSTLAIVHDRSLEEE
jgi:phosphatidylserine decarboxylase